MKYYFPYWGPFVCQLQIEQELIDILLEKGKESQKKHLDARKKLAGVIDNSYYFEDYESWFLPKFIPYIDHYIEALRANWISHHPKLKNGEVRDLWINYQRAKEYNPPHNHGGDLSFVIYLQVPEEIVIENKETKHEHNNPGPGMICFEFGQDMLFTIARFAIMPEVGQAFIFPAWLSHHVLAFKSNVERISVSGNIIFKDDKI